MAFLEEGEDACAFASGMAAITAGNFWVSQGWRRNIGFLSYLWLHLFPFYRFIA
jgi:cystathionine beta-lyase/cystathionine gamma-synthase